ncbi:Uncharacterised protein [Slackia heliotrinireducens]|uniref:Uncharacterized protein n=1 Tax=Slackia heliotrinireducens (strain ATCC 29202 / DSM 20476 / NCTC 11029 / RHS 1) TaxID=471855 RepID=C7N6Q2_SLAHD|nr:hypothetical protein [Slackia heliotrinireducens]ACV22587.1 hypothetical protein Shel_15680 [Slackia heliotrinireducens DSM 20476]VEH01085.1 Uncharacterised protein [Slackia heliotrinireducens]
MTDNRTAMELHVLRHENAGLRRLVSDMHLTWKRLDLEGDWPESGHNGWRAFERRMAELGVCSDGAERRAGRP